jgi:hypothetical protein
MKILVRAFVIALALTGALATAHANATPATATVKPAKVSAMPVPLCDPNDPGDCGLGTL